MRGAVARSCHRVPLASVSNSELRRLMLKRKASAVDKMLLRRFYALRGRDSVLTLIVLCVRRGGVIKQRKRTSHSPSASQSAGATTQLLNRAPK